ncbi:MAG TPA: hypothetical protein PLY08_03350 [Bacillota bacterium]|nr:hypothetical protein [Bacillota bacterium]
MFTDNRRRGSLIVDAACCIPVFIIAITTLLFLILQCGIEETVCHVLVQSARCSARAAALASVEEEADRRIRSVFAVSWEGMLLSEWGLDHPDAALCELRTGETAELAGGSLQVDHLTRARVSVKNALFSKSAMSADPKSYKNGLFRPFVGESAQIGSYDPVQVYVFPKRGERYHVRDCPVLQGGQVEVVLTEEIRRRYRACELCRPEALPNGAPVWLYSAESRVYHRHTCASITKSYICMSRSEAIASGYTPCRICGGGHP